MADVEKIIINEQSYPVKDANAVSVLEQSLTAEQKAQVQANIGVTAATNVYTKSETDTLLNGKISTTAKGTSNGVAELDGNGKVPSSQLPSFVDDVVEGYYKTDSDRFYEESTFTTLIEPVAGKSWVDIPTNKSYRWTGSVYTRVDEGVQIGETADTAYAGNKGKANADAIAAIKDGVSIDSFSDVETALAGKVDVVQGKGLSTNDYTDAEKAKLAGLENYDDTGIQEDISAIEEVIPSTATSQNPLATADDIPTDALKYTAQTLTEAQQAQARTNIGAASADSVPTPEQQAAWSAKQDALTFDSAPTSGSNNPVTSDGIYNALQNAGVQSNWNESDSSSKAFINNKPLIQKGSGTGGNIEGGTGITKRMNSARYANSVAYGYMANADGNYTLAYGEGVMARHHYEIALGKYNVSNADTAFSIGDGPGVGADSRHNLMELKTDGRMFLNGNAVKTEGGDDNKLRLGQICGLDTNHYFRMGFGKLMGAATTGVTFLSSIDTKEESIYLSYLFGDFLAYKATSSGGSMAYVAPIPGRREDAIKTGAWILIENCYEMFKDMTSSSFTSLDLSMFDTSKCKNMNRMFTNCTKLTSLDLSAFDTSMVTDMGAMFSGCNALTTLDISSFDMTNVNEYSGMLISSTALTTLKTPKINPHDDIPLPRTLYSQDGTAYTNLPVTTGTSIELRQSWT